MRQDQTSASDNLASRKRSIGASGYYIFQRRPDDMTCSIHVPDGLHIGNLRSEWAGDFAEAVLNVLVDDPTTFQSRVAPWMQATFGPMISGDKQERAHRFIEEALELVQSTGTTAREAHQLVDYVFGRTVGETHQEVGGVMVTLAALCLAHALDMHQAAETELARVWTKVEQIRAKHAAKPKHSPLPTAEASR